MDILPIPAGERFIDLVEDSSQSSTESCEIVNEIDKDEENPSEDVEITNVKLPDAIEEAQIPEKIPQIILPEEMEIFKMKQEERYGYLFRVQDRQEYVQDRVRGVVRAIDSEPPEIRKARRQSFQEAICGKFRWLDKIVIGFLKDAEIRAVVMHVLGILRICRIRLLVKYDHGILL